MRPILMLSAVILGALLAGAARADVQISSESTNAANGRTSPTDMYFTADRLKMDMDRMAIIYRDDTGTIYNVMKDQHRYMVFDAAAQQRMAATMSAMQQQIQSLPEAQRRMIQARGMPGTAQPQADVPFVKTGESRKVGAWSCQVFRKSLGGGTTIDSCFAPVSAIGLTRDDLAVLRKLAERMRKAMPMGGVSNNMDFDRQAQALGFEGFPVQTITSMNGAPSTTTTLKSVQHLTLPADTFEVPAGYARQEMPGPGR